MNQLGFLKAGQPHLHSLTQLTAPPPNYVISFPPPKGPEESTVYRQTINITPQVLSCIMLLISSEIEYQNGQIRGKLCAIISHMRNI